MRLNLMKMTVTIRYVTLKLHGVVVGPEGQRSRSQDRKTFCLYFHTLTLKIDGEDDGCVVP